jgi:hypothetical protein
VSCGLRHCFRIDAAEFQQLVIFQYKINKLYKGNLFKYLDIALQTSGASFKSKLKERTVPSGRAMRIKKCNFLSLKTAMQ